MIPIIACSVLLKLLYWVILGWGCFNSLLKSLFCRWQTLTTTMLFLLKSFGGYVWQNCCVWAINTLHRSNSVIYPCTRDTSFSFALPYRVFFSNLQKSLISQLWPCDVRVHLETAQNLLPRWDYSQHQMFGAISFFGFYCFPTLQRNSCAKVL